jgi:hypothetical protein
VAACVGLGLGRDNALEAGGQPIQLRGVNRAGYAQCDFTVFDHYSDTLDGYADAPVDQRSVDAMRSWGVDARPRAGE